MKPWATSQIAPKAPMEKAKNLFLALSIYHTYPDRIYNIYVIYILAYVKAKVKKKNGHSKIIRSYLVAPVE